MRKHIKIRRIILFVLIFVIYYQLDYKRYFISNKDKTEYFTIWQRLGNNCYIIPGRYFWIFPPRRNYIKTVNYINYIGVVWDTKDKYKYKIAIYNDFEKIKLQDNIKVYQKNDSLLLEYHILDTLDVQRGKRIRSKNEDSLLKVYDYNYIDLNKIFGIGVEVYANNKDEK